MRRWQPTGLVLVLCLTAFACKKPTTTQVETSISDDQNLNKPIEVNASELLEKDRKDLAAQEVEFFDRVTYQKKVLKEKPVEAVLLDKLRYPLEIPVWQEAKYSEADGLSLPPYLPAGKKDNALAWHLARFGDLESAKKIAEESHYPALTELHQAHYERNYPVEWSRLIGRIQHLGHMRLVTGELDGATLLIELHNQLLKTLDAKAQKSPLGAALLRQGRVTLQNAETAWRGIKKTQLADQLKDALAKWGDVPAPTFPALIGSPRTEINRMLGTKSEEGVIALDDPRRALDVLDLPVMRDQVEGIAFTFDADKKVREIYVTYPPGTGRTFSSPAPLATPLEEHGIKGKDGSTVAEVRQRNYAVGGATCNVFLLLQNAHVGALAVIQAEAAKPTTSTLRRDFDIVHLDAGFEFNRYHFNRHKLGDKVESKDKETLDDLVHPLPLFNPLSAARIERAPNGQATDRLVIVGDKRRVPTLKLMAGLWQEAGPGVGTGVVDPDGGHFAITWEDKATLYTLRIPNVATHSPTWEAADLKAGKDQVNRDEAARKFDAARRQERIDNKDPWDPLPRSIQIHQFKLGDNRALVEKVLPQAEKMSYGLRYVFPDKPAVADTSTTNTKTTRTPGKPTPGKPGTKPMPSAPKVEEPEYSPRQMVLRFDGQNKLVEIRLFVQENTTKTGSMLGKYQAIFGVNPAIESPWAALWKDLPPMKPTPAMAQWRDDITLFSCQRSGFGTELIVRDCTLEQPEGVKLPEFTFLSRGPADVKLGDVRADLIANWKGPAPKPVTEDPLILEPARGGPYDMYYLWFAEGKCIRIVARYALPPNAKITAPERTTAIMKAWSPMMKEVGFWSRCDVVGEKAGQYVKSYGWSDDKTRLRLYWEDDKTGAHLYTEWRALTSEK